MGDIIQQGTYRKITVTVPDAPTEEPMPASMNFYVDSRFTTAQVTRLREMIAGVLAFWREHQEQINNGEISRYASCVNKYARFNLAPVWFSDRLANGRAAADVQMAGFTTQIQANGFNRAARAYIKYQEPTGQNFTIRGLNASNLETNSLSVTVNPKALSNSTASTLMLTGSLFHAWLHRGGYRHPAGRYTSYFAGEASMCIMRGNLNKAPGVPASTYTKWLD
ncbi:MULTISPECIES: hypothetical protein [unclassified Paenibacillus]|uniref:hypothetical protein n=1 Tax=unclassified Paenibacillus TaxID=185978 RepID=UPI000CFCF842|nr:MULTISPECIES: hypothetical protein [unclassified Paenibacillus]PRA04844.1 hypothetical protein CQ043_12375 [Paenibacillus sp. MYb63]PRA47811.1 hypothetical protein CQ061_14455 [Paenibacillus sp. MYb67]